MVTTSIKHVLPARIFETSASVTSRFIEDIACPRSSKHLPSKSCAPAWRIDSILTSPLPPAMALVSLERSPGQVQSTTPFPKHPSMLSFHCPSNCTQYIHERLFCRSLGSSKALSCDMSPLVAPAWTCVRLRRHSLRLCPASLSCIDTILLPCRIHRQARSSILRKSLTCDSIHLPENNTRLSESRSDQQY